MTSTTTARDNAFPQPRFLVAHPPLPNQKPGMVWICGTGLVEDGESCLTRRLVADLDPSVRSEPLEDDDDCVATTVGVSLSFHGSALPQTNGSHSFDKKVV